MKNRLAAWWVIWLFLQPVNAQYRTAVPGYRFEFPRDYFNHPDFQTEWWYYTGNLTASDGRHFGFELTFFRQAISREQNGPGDWTVPDIYLAHFALSDLDGQKFYHSERVNRAGPGIAGVSGTSERIWNGNWQVQWKDSEQQLEAIEERFQIRLNLHSRKPPVIHGENGVSQKAAGSGNASYYVSLTRLAAAGEIILDRRTIPVSGLAWMDHEFFTEQLTRDQTGWDWLSIQLTDKTELMLFHLRRKDGSVDPYSAGTYVDALGKSTHLRNEDFALQPGGDTWASPATHAVYPVAWRIAVPKLSLELAARTRLRDQELTSSSALTPSYWEGAIALTGHHGSQEIGGAGYLEMTGYAGTVKLTP